jgi:predicted LPLAT superfamily acyltransferase
VAERGSLWGLRFTVFCYRVLGRRASLVLVHAVVGYFFLTDRAGRRASRAFLRRVFSRPEGRLALGRRPGTWASFLHYRSFALSIVDRLAIWFGRAGDFEFEIHGSQHFDRLAAEGRGALVVGAHLGSFDALRLLAERRRAVVNVLMFTRHAPLINRIFRELAPGAEARVIQPDPGSVQSVFAIRRCVERGELVAILGDRVEPADRHRTAALPFLGGTVELPLAPYLLAGLLGCPVLLVLALRRGPGRYEVFVEELAPAARPPRGERGKVAGELLAAYAGRLEAHLLRAPLQWYNFFDYWGDAEPVPSGREAG